MKQLHAFVVLAVLTPALGWGQVGAAPIPVSPGSVERPSGVASQCPTFSWGPVPGAVGQELVLVEVADREGEAEETTPLTRVDLPGTASSWTPSAEQCPEPAKAYGWSIRAIGEDGPSQWSETRLFRVAPPATVRPAPPLIHRRIENPRVRPLTGQADTATAARGERAPAGTPSGIFVDGLAVPAGQEVAFAETECPASALCATSVFCGNGKVALGGGANLLPTSGGLVFYGSHPGDSIPPGQTWESWVLNTTATPSTFRAYAICTVLAGIP